mmetsp:Transcript_66871/g.157578  ORF Transcript_66871/g.157578 Transcript_66871/m.157578 type:complete len:258 (-) Transcript_66871:16-789(-)
MLGVLADVRSLPAHGVWQCGPSSATPRFCHRVDVSAQSGHRRLPLPLAVASALSGLAWSRQGRGHPRSARAAAGSEEATESDNNCMVCGGSDVAQPVRRRLLQAGFLLVPAPAGAAGVRRIVEDSANCLNCGGTGILTCYRCKGTKKMSEIDDPTRFRDCIECETTGYVVCGRCQATGLSAAKLKKYNRDEKFKKVVARNRKTKCDEDGREKLKRVMAAAIAEVEAKTAAAEGREAEVIRVPEAPKAEPKGTWMIEG